MVRGALTLSFEENQEVCEILPIPGGKRFQELQPFALGIDDDFDRTGVRRRGTYPLSPFSNPRVGSSCPVGGSSLTSSPRSLTRVSLRGLKLSFPATASAVTIS